jgi:hypothetical protein
MNGSCVAIDIGEKKSVLVSIIPCSFSSILPTQLEAVDGLIRVQVATSYLFVSALGATNDREYQFRTLEVKTKIGELLACHEIYRT